MCKHRAESPLTSSSSVLIIHTIQSKRRHQTLTTSLPRDETPLLGSSAIHPRLEAVKSSTDHSTASGQSTPSIRSGASTPPLVNYDVPDDIPPRKGQVALLLTPAQKRMSRNLEAALPHVERIVAWFPWAFNSHALLVVR